MHAELSSLSELSGFCRCPTRKGRALAYFLHLLSCIKENQNASLLNHREVVVKSRMRNSSQAKATWVPSRLYALSLEHSSTNTSVKAEMAKSGLNIEATRRWKFLLKIHKICYHVLSAERELSVNDETFTLLSVPGREIDLDQLLIIASPSNQQLSDHIPQS